MQGKHAPGKKSGENDDRQRPYSDGVGLGNEVGKIVGPLKNIANRAAGEQGIVLHRNDALLGNRFNRIEWHMQAEGTTWPRISLCPDHKSRVSQISRKTSEMWGTRDLWSGQNGQDRVSGGTPHPSGFIPQESGATLSLSFAS